MAFTPEFIQQVRDASDIVGVIQQWVPLKKAGVNYKGLCPFHNEKSPSFHVHPAKQMFHCFGCNEGGDVFAFVQKISKVGFGEALKVLAERAGIELPEETRDAGLRQEEEARRKELEELSKLMDLAAVWFRRHLEESEEAAPARAYAEKRGLDAAARDKFQLGWAPNDGRALVQAAVKKGYSEAQLEKAGLLLRSERGPYGRFRSRLMFPISDPKGRMAGFGGRIVGEGEPKYLNSPEGPLFSKGKLLYPWPLAKEALGKAREALVVEGYMDAIACHQYGFAQAVATLGTALTEDHAKLLKRYVNKVVLLFDADAAGLRAARRAGEALTGTGLEIRVARLSGAKDPDELLRAKGAEGLQEALTAAVPLFDFCVATGLLQAQAAGGLTPQSRVAVLSDLYPMLAKLASAVETEAELYRAADTLGVSHEAAAADYAAFKKGNRPFGKLRAGSELVASNPSAGSGQAQPPAPVRAPEGLLLAERELLRLLVCEPALVEEAKLDLAQPKLSAPDLQAAVELLWRAPEGNVMALPDDGTEAYQLGENLLRELSFQTQTLPEGLKPIELLRDLLAIRQERMLERDRADLKLALRQVEGPAATEVLKKIQLTDRALQDLRRERRQKHLLANDEESA